MTNKNPTALKIGQRMRQARLMAGYQTGAELLQVLSEWGRGRLGNYETGVSIPSPDDLLYFCQTTGASPCWVMFGIGPIKADHRDIQAIRHQNLEYCVNQFKQQRKLNRYLKGIGMARPKLDQLLDNPFATINDRIARKTEVFLKKNQGWMDEQHVESDPICMAFPDELRELMSIYSEMDAPNRAKLLDIARVLQQTI
ncbi:MAG: helix-turn-helix domain-containing protein [Gammaproteobacteria bacterium]|nr:helix-turn-helix domain-containing protein [Gammaproteobacteria bacterium]MDH5727649.1 helix-turn-helix domain-containing protein [Gammaproteobacteria bacterium]